MDSFIIFEILIDRGIKPIGMIDNYISLMYTKYATDTGSFELHIPYSREVFDLVKRNDEMEKLILLEDNIVGICHKLNPVINLDKMELAIQGSLANGLLDNYCVGKVERLKTATESPQDLLNFPVSLQYIIQHPQNNISGGLWDAISYSLPSDYYDSTWDFTDGYLGGQCTFERYIQNCVRLLNKIYSVDYNKQNNNFDLVLKSPVDRTINQNINPAIVLSTNFGDFLSSEYVFNSKDYKNIVVAFTNVNDSYYEQVVTYDDMPNNFPQEKKRVAYCEIADISGLDEQGQELSQEDILGLLRQKGKSELYNFALVSEYKCKLSQDTRFKYGIDYFLGDKITIQDSELGLILDVEISGYTKTKSISGDNFEPIIGIPQPTLTQVLKRKGLM